MQASFRVLDGVNDIQKHRVRREICGLLPEWNCLGVLWRLGAPSEWFKSSRRLKIAGGGLKLVSRQVGSSKQVLLEQVGIPTILTASTHDSTSLAITQKTRFTVPDGEVLAREHLLNPIS